MADPATKQTNSDPTPQNIPLEDPLPSPDDPGGAHAKGYSADPRPEVDVPDKGPVPLAPGHEGESAVRQPERDGKVRPTGRSDDRGYSPNDRLMGSDR